MRIPKSLRKIVFLATAQHDEHNPWLPNERGILRIQAAMRCLEANPDAMLMVAGGYANHLGFTYADRMVGYIAEHHSWALERLMVVSGNFNRAIDDLFQTMLIIGGLMEEQGWVFVSSGCEVHFVSEYTHYSRCDATMMTLGFMPVWVNSGADNSIYDSRDLDMVRENALPGKVLGLGPESILWRDSALRNAQAQAAECAAWALKHPQQDQQWAAKLGALLRQQAEEGCYIESPALGPLRPRPAIPTFLPH